MLFERNKALSDEESKQLNSKITSSAERLRGLTQAVLQLSVLQDSVSMEPVDLQAALDLAINDLEITIQEKKAVVQVDGNLPTVLGNTCFQEQGT